MALEAGFMAVLRQAGIREGSPHPPVCFLASRSALDIWTPAKALLENASTKFLSEASRRLGIITEKDLYSAVCYLS